MLTNVPYRLTAHNALLGWNGNILRHIGVHKLRTRSCLRENINEIYFKFCIYIFR